MSEPRTFEEFYTGIEKPLPHGGVVSIEYLRLFREACRISWQAGRRAGIEEAAAHSEDTGHKRDPSMLAEEIRALKDRGPSDG